MQPVKFVIPGRCVPIKNNICVSFLKARANRLIVVRDLLFGNPKAPTRAGQQGLRGFPGNCPIHKALAVLIGASISKKSIWKKYLAKALKVVHVPEAFRPLFGGWVHVLWTYYPPDRAHKIDQDAICASVQDIMQRGGVLGNDRWVAHDDGSRIMLPVGEAEARLEFVVSEYLPPTGEYRG